MQGAVCEPELLAIFQSGGFSTEMKNLSFSFPRETRNSESTPCEFKGMAISQSEDYCTELNSFTPSLDQGSRVRHSTMSMLDRGKR
jgi:hypothetical protein